MLLAVTGRSYPELARMPVLLERRYRYWQRRLLSRLRRDTRLQVFQPVRVLDSLGVEAFQQSKSVLRKDAVAYPLATFWISTG